MWLFQVHLPINRRPAVGQRLRKVIKPPDGLKGSMPPLRFAAFVKPRVANAAQYALGAWRDYCHDHQARVEQA